MESTEGPQNSVSKQPSKWAFPPWHCSGFTGDSLRGSTACVWNLRALCPVVSVHIGFGDTVLFSLWVIVWVSILHLFCVWSSCETLRGFIWSCPVNNHCCCLSWFTVASRHDVSSGSGHFLSVPGREKRRPWLVGEKQESPSCLPRTPPLQHTQSTPYPRVHEQEVNCSSPWRKHPPFSLEETLEHLSLEVWKASLLSSTARQSLIVVSSQG